MTEHHPDRQAEEAHPQQEQPEAASGTAAETPVDTTAPGATPMPPQPTAIVHVPLAVLPQPLLGDDAAGFRERWEPIQIAFIDDPAQAVDQAHTLVGDLIERISTVIESARAELDRERTRAGLSTEERRILLQRYRSMFWRLADL